LRAFPGARRELIDTSEKRWELCAAESRRAPAASCLDGDLERVTGVMEDTTMDRELARVRGGVAEHAATIAYRIRDVEVYDGSLYRGAARQRLLRDADAERDEAKVQPAGSGEIEEGAMACTLYGSFYFGHWMTDDLTLHLAAESVGKPLTVARNRYGHEPGYCDLFGIRPSFVTRTRCASLVIFQDFGQNTYKRQRYALLRSRLRSAVAGTGNARAFIRRGSSGASRSLVNAEQLEAFLAARGFAIVDPERLTPREIAAQLQDAKLVVGVEGSHLMHGVFSMAENGTLCVLQPPYRFNNWSKDMCDCLEMGYAFTTGKTVDGGFIVEQERLERLLEKIESGVGV
jgi:hypothetical protein